LGPFADEEPEVRIERIRPVRSLSENLSKEASRLTGLVTVSLKLGALKNWQKIGAVLVASGNGACLHLLQYAKPLSSDVGQGLLHTFLCDNAGHFIKDLCGSVRTLDLSKGISCRRFANKFFRCVGVFVLSEQELYALR
jgi:hypothetical protein